MKLVRFGRRTFGPIRRIDHVTSRIDKALVRQEVGLWQVHLPAGRADERMIGLHVTRISCFRKADCRSESWLSSDFWHWVTLLPLAVPVRGVKESGWIAGSRDEVNGWRRFRWE